MASPTFGAYDSGANQGRTLVADQAGSAGNVDLAAEIFDASVLEGFRTTNVFFNDLPSFCDLESVDGRGGTFTWRITDEGQVVRAVDPGVWDDGDVTFQIKRSASAEDTILVSETFAKEDISRDHTDGITKKGSQMGYRLGRRMDQRLARYLTQVADEAAITETEGVLGAGTALDSTTRTVRKAGTVVQRTGASDTAISAISDAAAYPNSSTGADRFLADVAEMAYQFDLKDAPEMGRILYIDPYVRQILAQQTNVFDRDYTSAGGDRNTRALPMLSGFMVKVSNALPSTNLSSANDPARYNADFRVYDGSGTNASFGRPVAIAVSTGNPGVKPLGGVEQFGLQTEYAWQERNRGVYSAAYMSHGFIDLFPEAVGTIVVVDDDAT